MEKFENVTVMFINAVDVNGMFTKLTPFRVANLLHDFFASIDHMLEQFLVQKVQGQWAIYNNCMKFYTSTYM